MTHYFSISCWIASIRSTYLQDPHTWTRISSALADTVRTILLYLEDILISAQVWLWKGSCFILLMLLLWIPPHPLSRIQVELSYLKQSVKKTLFSINCISSIFKVINYKAGNLQIVHANMIYKLCWFIHTTRHISDWGD